MCNLSEGIREKAAKQATFENALNLMKSLKMSAEDVLNAMRVPVKNRSALLKSINERLAAE